ncbi:hypothetical protein RRG08_007762 [Elysia crispata]|uniref:Uncharacterized protein n=1 Tax=Elysia crispata TaxID=231223 RepID=A0AAE1B3J7_9GAST|nr:hypothetical protein RRG08_007762 [Elysia crispata]
MELDSKDNVSSQIFKKMEKKNRCTWSKISRELPQSWELQGYRQVHQETKKLESLGPTEMKVPEEARIRFLSTERPEYALY